MQFITTVNWWQANKPQSENAPKAHHEVDLEVFAFTHIHQQIEAGNTSGELLLNLNKFDSDGEDGVDYRGHWSFEAHTPIGTAENPVVAVVQENKESGGFLMSVSNVDHCDVVLVEEDLCGDGNEVDIEGRKMVGWATSCEKDVSRTALYSEAF